MGCSASEPIHIINSVDQELLDAQEEEKYQHKILLLGAGESGKSTVVKQIKMIWKVGGGPSDKERQEYILAIRRNAIEAIQTLLEVIAQRSVIALSSIIHVSMTGSAELVILLSYPLIIIDGRIDF